MFRLGRAVRVLVVVALLSALAVVSPIGPAPRPAFAYPLGDGYWLALEDGAVVPFGDAQYFGSMHGTPLTSPIVAMAPFPFLEGYWLAAADGGIFAFGASKFYGSLGDLMLNAPIVGMAATPSGAGYWLVASDGGVFAFGDAGFFGSQGGSPLNKPIVGMSATPTGNGYYLVASDGGIFTHGDAVFYGSQGAIALNQPIVAMTTTASGKGYYLVAADGGMFTHGDATFYGSEGDRALNSPVTAMVLSATGLGYTLIARDGGVFTHGDAPFSGSIGDRALPAPVRTAALRPRLAAATIPLTNSSSSLSQWIDDGAGNWQLYLVYLGGDLPAGARIAGIEGIDVEQLGEVSFVSGDEACLDVVLGYDRGEGTEVATFSCVGSESSDPQSAVRPADTVPGDALVVGLQLRLMPTVIGIGAARLDDITVAGITMGGPGTFRLP